MLRRKRAAQVGPINRTMKLGTGDGGCPASSFPRRQPCAMAALVSTLLLRIVL